MKDERVRATERDAVQSDAPSARAAHDYNLIRLGGHENGYLRMQRAANGRHFEATAQAIDSTGTKPVNLTPLLGAPHRQIIDYCVADNMLYLALSMSRALAVTSDGRIMQIPVPPHTVGVISYQGQPQLVVQSRSNPLDSIAYATALADHPRTRMRGTIRACVQSDRLIANEYSNAWRRSDHQAELGAALYVQDMHASLLSPREDQDHYSPWRGHQATPAQIIHGLLLPNNSRLARGQFIVPREFEEQNLSAHFDHEGNKLLQEMPRTLLDAIVRSGAQ